MRFAVSSTSQVAVASRQARARSATASPIDGSRACEDRDVHQPAQRRLAELVDDDVKCGLKNGVLRRQAPSVAARAHRLRAAPEPFRIRVGCALDPPAGKSAVVQLDQAVTAAAMAENELPARAPLKRLRTIGESRLIAEPERVETRIRPAAWRRPGPRCRGRTSVETICRGRPSTRRLPPFSSTIPRPSTSNRRSMRSRVAKCDRLPAAAPAAAPSGSRQAPHRPEDRMRTRAQRSRDP